tara:strand:+ start:2406 stop:3299 length:894 start_codon:yes stop_codon:yes gene_type:complete
MSEQPKPPAAPDYAAAAKQTSAGNASQAQVAQYGSMTNQVTPYGTVDYTRQQIGTTPQGDPLNQWTQTMKLSPAQQALYDQNQAINAQLGDIAQTGVGQVQQSVNNPLNFSQNQALQAPGQIQQQASNAAYQNAAQYLDPQFQQSNAQLATRLANQGITQGSEAYNNAMLNAGNAQQQAYESARNQAYLQGQQGAQQQYAQGLGTRQQQIAEQQVLRQDPLNTLNAIRSGQQMQVAQMPQVGVSNPAALQATQGPDMLGAVTAQGQYNQGLYNAQSAAAGQTNAALIGAGGSIIGAF